MTKRDEIVAEAKTWLGTPWHHQGRIKGGGVDCVMLLAEVYEAVGIVPHIEPEYYPIDIMMHRGGEHVLGWLEMYGVETKEPEPGDIVIYRFGYSYSHGGIIVDNELNIVHAFKQYGMVVLSKVDE